MRCFKVTKRSQFGKAGQYVEETAALDCLGVHNKLFNGEDVLFNNLLEEIHRWSPPEVWDSVARDGRFPEHDPSRAIVK